MRKLLVIALFLASPLHAADIDDVRRNFLNFYTASGADRTSARMQQSLGELEGAARTVTAPGFLLSDGSWSDIQYNETPGGSWGPWDHAKRVTFMVKAYKTPGQPFYWSPQLLAQIDSAMGKMADFYGATRLPLGNWWFWTMGIPLDLGPQLVLMRGEISQKTFDDLASAMALRIGSNPAGRGLVGPTPTGENLVWSSFTHLTLGLVRDDPAMLIKVRDAMAGVTLPAAGEGIKSDSSFHQHGAQLYTGGYGGSFANDVSRYALITRGTAYALPDQSLAAFNNYVADGISWSLFGSYFDVSVVGREVARRSTTGYNGVASLLQASQIPSARSDEIRSAAARMLQSWPWGLPSELAGLAAIVERSGSVAAWPEGHRHYPSSDYTVHRRPAWFASIKMFSNRTKSGEKTNDENLLGSRQSDGRLYLVREGDEYFGRDVWPAIDWTRLPGITVEQTAAAASDLYGYGTRAIAGGTGDGRNGVSAMEVAPIGSSLTAKKSWFFFDDSIVFLTNSITALTGNRVETVVNQWPLKNPKSAVVSGSGWSVADNIGYWFPSAAHVQTRREQRTGSWASLGGSTDTTPHTHTFLTTWIDHGDTPSGAKAEYVIVPGITAAQMPVWIATNGISIVANDPVVSAVRRGQSFGVVFWSPGSIDGYEASAPAVIYAVEESKGLLLTAADPTNGIGTTRITVPGRWIGANAITSTRSTTIDVPRNAGETYRLLLTPAPPIKRRAARR